MSNLQQGKRARGVSCLQRGSPYAYSEAVSCFPTAMPPPCVEPMCVLPYVRVVRAAMCVLPCACVEPMCVFPCPCVEPMCVSSLRLCACRTYAEPMCVSSLPLCRPYGCVVPAKGAGKHKAR